AVIVVNEVIAHSQVAGQEELRSAGFPEGVEVGVVVEFDLIVLDQRADAAAPNAELSVLQDAVAAHRHCVAHQNSRAMVETDLAVLHYPARRQPIVESGPMNGAVLGAVCVLFNGQPADPYVSSAAAEGVRQNADLDCAAGRV